MRRIALFSLLVPLALATGCSVPPTISMPAVCDGPPPHFDGDPSDGVSVSVGRIDGLIWMPRRIDGVPVPADADLSLSVGDAGVVMGSTGCNRFTGTAELDAGVLELGPLAMTKMACAEPERQALEAAWLKALGETRGFVVSPRGLWLQREDGSEAACLGG